MGKTAPTKKVGVNEAEARILDYLQQTNRPYSAIDVFNNLRQEIQKSTVQKALTHLSSQQEIVCKTYGKQQVYVARQDLLEAPSAEDLEALDAQILALKEESVRMKEQLKLQQSILNELTSSLTDAQIQQRLSDLASENTKLEERLVRLRQGVEVIDEEERLSIERLYEEHRKQWRLRKKMVKEMIDLISEGADMKPKVFMQQLQLEEDEDVGDSYEHDYNYYMDTQQEQQEQEEAA